jgi:hypothetical protein
VLRHAGHGQRMQRLQQQRAQAADQHRQVAVDAPGHAVRAEQPAVARRCLDRSPRRGVAGEEEADAVAHPAAQRTGERAERRERGR